MSDLIDFTKYIDKNGWTVRNYGNHKVYTRKYSWTGSTAIDPNESFVIPQIALPEGVATRQEVSLVWLGRASDRTFLLNERTSNSSNYVGFECNNWYSARMTCTRVDIDLIGYDI